jgi:hypothetical protein
MPFEDLSEEELEWLRKEQCPDCRSYRGFLRGPRAGLAVNVKCANPECGSRFNVGPLLLGAQRISEPMPDKPQTSTRETEKSKLTSK